MRDLFPAFHLPAALCLSVLLLFVGLAGPARAQDTPVSGSEANDALAQLMSSHGLTPAEGLSVADYIETRTSQGSDGAIRHVRLHIGPEGRVIPKPEWQTYHPTYCKQRARYFQETDKVLDFKIIRSTESANGVTRNQLTVFARLQDRASDGTLTTIQQQEGEATNMTGVQRADEGYVADALEAAYDKLQGQVVQAPASSCGEVRLKHVAGEEKGDDFVFQAGFQGSYGRSLSYTWDFGDGSGPVSGGKRAHHVYQDDGTYEVSVRVDGENVEPGAGTVSVVVGDEEKEEEDSNLECAVPSELPIPEGASQMRSRVHEVSGGKTLCIVAFTFSEDAMSVYGNFKRYAIANGYAIDIERSDGGHGDFAARKGEYADAVLRVEINDMGPTINVATVTFR